MEYKSHNL